MTIKLLAANSTRSKELVDSLCEVFSLELVEFSEGGEFGENFTAVLKAGPGETFTLEELSSFTREIEEIGSALDVPLETSFLDNIQISSVKGRRVTSATSDPIDTLSFNVPALLRCLEVARESLTSDKQVHLFVEALQAVGGIPLTTEVIEQAAKAISNE